MRIIRRPDCRRRKYRIWMRLCACGVVFSITWTVFNINIELTSSMDFVQQPIHPTIVANRTNDTTTVLRMHNDQSNGRKENNLTHRNLSESAKTNNTTINRDKPRIYPGRKSKNQYKLQGQAIPNGSPLSQLSVDVITPQDFKLLLPGRDVCGNSTHLMLIMLVPTTHAETDVRYAIRDTWGSYKGVAMRIAFLLGAPPTPGISAQVQWEAVQQGDIVMADFNDTYPNLGYKVLMGLRWVEQYCPQAEFIVKVDSDMFVNVSALVNILRNNPPASNGTIYGDLVNVSVVHRRGNWGMSREIFPYHYYPPYMQGPCYVMSTGLAGKLYMASRHFPYLRREDALITGCLSPIVGAQLKHVQGFLKRVDSKQQQACEYLKSGLISLTPVTPRLMYDLWSALPTYPSSCNATASTFR